MTHNPYKILIVEDEVNLGETLKDFLESKGYICSHAQTVSLAREEFLKLKPHVVLMDIGLPDGNGIDLAEELRNEDKSLIILFLSALNDPETKLSGLSMGADDYITKPFDVRELILRLERILQNKTSLLAQKDEIHIGDLIIWFKRFEVQNGLGEIKSLSQKECHILEILYKKKNEVVSRDEIIEKVWGINSFPSNRTVDNYIVNLRKWLDTSQDKSVEISSVRGIGYKFIIKE
jgi:two-component system alkaline phosphatase synthesis response regulator PhoP